MTSFSWDPFEYFPGFVAALNRLGEILWQNKTWIDHVQSEQPEPVLSSRVGESYQDHLEKLADCGDAQIARAVDGLKSVLRGEKTFFQLEGLLTASNQKPSFLFYVSGTVDEEKILVYLIDVAQRGQAGSSLNAPPSASQSDGQLPLPPDVTDLSHLVGSVEDIVFTLDMGGRFSGVFGKWLERYGFTADYFLGKTVAEVLGTKNVGMHEAAIQQALQGEYVLYEWIYQDESGTFYIQSSLSLIRNKDGEAIGLVGIGRDVTRHKQDEKQLRLLAAAVEYAANAVVITDDKTNYQYVNPAFEEITGYSQKDVVGSCGNLLHSGVHGAEFYRALTETLQQGKVWRGEFVNRRKNGELYHELNAISPLFDENGKLTNYIAIKQDISEIKRAQQSEEEQRRMTETLMEVASVLNRSLHIDDTLDLILANISKVLPVEAIDITLIQNGIAKSVRDMGFIEWNLTNWLHNNEYPVNSFPIFNQIYETRLPVLVSDTRENPNWIFLPQTEWIRSYIGAPILFDNEVLGMISIHHTEPGIYNETHIRHLKVFADHASIALQNAHMFEESQQQIRRLASLRHIDNAIGSSLDLDLTLRIVIDQVVQQLRVDAAAVYLLDSHMHELECRASYGLSAVAAGIKKFSLSEFPGNDVVLSRKTTQYDDAQNHLSGYGHFHIFGDFSSIHMTPLLAKGQVKGVLIVLMRSAFTPTAEWKGFFEMLAGQTAIAVDNAQLYRDLLQANSQLLLSYNATLEGWVNTLDVRNQEEEGHSWRLAEQTLNMAREMGMYGEDLQQVYRGALLHDIGTIIIPEEILQKKAPLTDQDWKVIRQHPIRAHQLLSSIAYLRPVLDIPYCHHERWDGSGYPRGLKGKEIPLPARIFAVIDVWGALRTDRPYRKAWPDAEALDYIRQQSGVLFDPEVVERFLSRKEFFTNG